MKWHLFRRNLRLPGALAVGLLGVSCSQVEQVGDVILYGSEAAAAKDQIMLVRKEPPSFGYQRLTTQWGVYPDLKIFVEKNGLPDFLAETGKGDRKYLILYYLGRREAYACRTRVENRKAVEFAGPYPITEREYKLLDGFRRDPTHPPAKW